MTFALAGILATTWQSVVVDASLFAILQRLSFFKLRAGG